MASTEPDQDVTPALGAALAAAASEQGGASAVTVTEVTRKELAEREAFLLTVLHAFRNHTEHEVRQELAEVRFLLDAPAAVAETYEPASRASVTASLLGQRVRVKLDEHVVTEGKLLGFDEGGEIQIEGDDGFVWHGWPALEVTPVAGDPS